MILACPNCRTRFNVPDGAVPAEGRKVRCAQCKHAWHAKREDALKNMPPVSGPPMPMAARPMGPSSAMAMGAAPMRAPQPVDPEPIDPEIAARTAAIRRQLLEGDSADAQNEKNQHSHDDEAYDGDYDDSGDQSAASAGPAPDFLSNIRDFADNAGIDLEDGDDFSGALNGVDDDDALARLRARERRAQKQTRGERRSRVISALWVLLALIWLGVFVTFFGFRPQVIAFWPASKLIYEKFDHLGDSARFQDEGEDLSPPITEEISVIKALLVATRVEEHAGETVLVLEGYVENAGRRSAKVPRLQAKILSVDGHVLDEWQFDPPGLLITRGQKLDFVEYHGPIPVGAHQTLIEQVPGVFSQTSAQDTH